MIKIPALTDIFSSKPRIMRNRFVRVISTARFGIGAIFVFAAAMGAGTICESLYGAEFVRRAVYHTWWFYLIQASMAASLFFAMLDRIPLRKKLTGFYVIHCSILTIMAGSVVTHLYGIDGSLELRGGEFNGSVRLNEDMVYISDGQQTHKIALPAIVRPVNLDRTFKLTDGATVTLRQYIPFAAEKKKWVAAPGGWASSWQLKNPRVDQQLDLIDMPGAPARADLGPLRLEVVSEAMFGALSKWPNARLLLVDEFKGAAYAVADADAPQSLGGGLTISRRRNSKISLTYFELKAGGEALKFFPRFSSKPVTGHLEKLEHSPYSLLDLSRFKSGNVVCLARSASGKIRLAFGKDGRWAFTEYGTEPVTLPWMDFTLRLLEDRPDQTSGVDYVAGTPNKDEEHNFKALLARVTNQGQTEQVWLTSREVSRSQLGLEEGIIGSRELKLPFAFTLDRFKMDVVPGTTDKPASYESFVSLQGQDGAAAGTAHIFMNNPLKRDGYTFYQASYLQDDEGRYHSILSVNRDPGRPVKYAGALFLIAGLLIHFLIIYGYVKVKSP